FEPTKIFACPWARAAGAASSKTAAATESSRVSLIAIPPNTVLRERSRCPRARGITGQALDHSRIEQICEKNRRSKRTAQVVQARDQALQCCNSYRWDG